MTTQTTSIYEIQTRNRKNRLLSEWSAESLFRDGNEFATLDEAWAAVEDLKTLGEEWLDCDYRVVEIARS